MFGKISIGTAFAVIALGLASVPTDAAVRVFSDRDAWRAAAGGGVGELREGFDGFSGTTNYGDPVGVDAGFLNFSIGSFQSGDNTWSIFDAGSSVVADGSYLTIDGSPAVSLVSLFGSGDTIVKHPEIAGIGFDYAGPGSAFGSPISGANPLRIVTSLSFEPIIGPEILPLEKGFFGILFTEGETFSQFEILDADNLAFFSGDNFEAFGAVDHHGAEAIPEGSHIAGMFSAGMLLLVGLRNHRAKAKQ